MHPDLDDLVAHDMSDDCPVCRAQEVVALALLPATAAWEASYELPRYALALHGAAELLGVMLAEGASRARVEEVLGQLLDDIEQRIAEDRTMGGPPQGTA
jgi:hypothetical protein